MRAVAGGGVRLGGWEGGRRPGGWPGGRGWGWVRSDRQSAGALCHGSYMKLMINSFDSGFGVGGNLGGDLGGNLGGRRPEM